MIFSARMDCSLPRGGFPTVASPMHERESQQQELNFRTTAHQSKLMIPAETISTEDLLLESLRARRWESLGGEGNPPDLTYLRDDCLEEIVAEFFEGEPSVLYDGKSLVSFGSSRERLFLVSELFTEYDPIARAWKTFHAARRGTEELSVAPCREDGSALDGYEQRAFRTLEKRAIVRYAGTSSKSRIEVLFQPVPLGEQVLYALVTELHGPDTVRTELGFEVRKARRRGRRTLKPDPLDIPMLIRQGQHLANQLLGRPNVSAKPVILEQLPPFKFSVEINQQVLEGKIEVLGADLTSSEHQALSGILKLLTLHGYREKTIRVFPEHWYEVYGVGKHEHSKRGVPQLYQRHKLQAIQALMSLAAKPTLISYKRRNENDRWDVVQRITTLIKVSSGYLDVADEEADQLMSGIRLNAVDNLRIIEIECDELFFDQINQHYFKRPKDLDERLKKASGQKRLPDSIFNFLTYIYSDGEMRRRKKGHNPDSDWKLVISLTDLAYLLRMKGRIKHGERGRILKEIDKIAGLVQVIGILESYDLADPEALVFEINGRKAFPVTEEETKLEGAEKVFPLTVPKKSGGLASGLVAIMEKPHLPIVQTVIEALYSSGEQRPDWVAQNSVARSIKNVAGRLLGLNIIISPSTLKDFLIMVASNVRERKTIKAIDRYFDATLEQRLLQAMEGFAKESKTLALAAESNPQAARKLEAAEDLIRSLTKTV
jgi:hypothetical protein